MKARKLNETRPIDARGKRLDLTGVRFAAAAGDAQSHFGRQSLVGSNWLHRAQCRALTDKANKGAMVTRYARGDPIMSSLRSLRCLNRLSAAQWWLLVRAVGALAAASAAVAMLPFKQAVGFGSVRLRSSRGGPAVRDCIWAVEAAARRVPWRALCFEQGLAVQRLLRKSGVDAVLHYGARQSPSNKLEAHVWVSVAGDVIIGGDEAAGFNEIASFR